MSRVVRERGVRVLVVRECHESFVTALPRPQAQVASSTRTIAWKESLTLAGSRFHATIRSQAGSLSPTTEKSVTAQRCKQPAHERYVRVHFIVVHLVGGHEGLLMAQIRRATRSRYSSRSSGSLSDRGRVGILPPTAL